MKFNTQNAKITAITEKTLVIGIDASIAKLNSTRNIRSVEFTFSK